MTYSERGSLFFFSDVHENCHGCRNCSKKPMSICTTMRWLIPLVHPFRLSATSDIIPLANRATRGGIHSGRNNHRLTNKLVDRVLAHYSDPLSDKPGLPIALAVKTWVIQNGIQNAIHDRDFQWDTSLAAQIAAHMAKSQTNFLKQFAHTALAFGSTTAVMTHAICSHPAHLTQNEFVRYTVHQESTSTVAIRCAFAVPQPTTALYMQTP